MCLIGDVRNLEHDYFPTCRTHMLIGSRFKDYHIWRGVFRMIAWNGAISYFPEWQRFHLPYIDTYSSISFIYDQDPPISV